MTSRFWLQPEEDEEDEELYSSSDEEPDQPGAKEPVHKFWDSDSSDEEKRVVISGRDKQLTRMKELIKLIRGLLKTGKWDQILKEWEDLNKLVKKIRLAAPTIAQGEAIPKFYVRMNAALEDTTNQTTEEQLLSFTKPQFRAFNQLKQKLKKLLNNDNILAKQVADYRTTGDDEDSEEWDSDLEAGRAERDLEEVETKPKKRKV